MYEAQPRSLGVRMLAVGSLLLVTAALYFMVTERPEGATASVAYSEELAGLTAASERVGKAVGKLEKGKKAAPARKRVRAAIAEVESAREWLEATPNVEDAALLRNALNRHREYLDAVGSVLANPRSSLRHRLDVRTERVRAAYAALPDSLGLDDQVGANLKSLKQYVKWRRSRL